MAKRTQRDFEEEDSDIDVSSTDDEELQEEEETVEDGDEMINIDFDFYNINPNVDFHATKNFLRQLFQDDAILFPLSELADIILQEGHVGTTIKTDGTESDPFSILSIVNITNNLKSKAIQELTKYYIEKTKKNPQFNVLLRQLFSPISKHKVGMIISERLVNMPVETMPPMYKMFLEEMEKAQNKEEEYNFDYFLIPSRVVKLVASVVDKELEDEDESTSRKKSKKSNNLPSEYDYVHYEDEQLEKNALHYGYFDFTNKTVEADARRVFNDYGIEPKLNLILINKKALANAVSQMAEAFPYEG
jgi:protein BCP1